MCPKGIILMGMSTTTTKMLPEWREPLLGGRRELALRITVTWPRSSNSS